MTNPSQNPARFCVQARLSQAYFGAKPRGSLQHTCIRAKTRVDASMNTTQRTELDAVTIRFAGDSGDGMQLTGSQFSQASAMMGNDLATFPDYPAEIRAPAGTTYGVSAFQVHFADHDIMTPGDQPDVLIAMNPAALKTQLPDLRERGTVIINTGAFTANNLRKAGYEHNPLEDDTLNGYHSIQIDISRLTLLAVEGYGLSNKEGLRSKNMWTLGMVMWLYGRDRTPTVDWLRKKFAKIPKVAESNVAALNAGHIYGENMELPHGISAYQIGKADLGSGMYRNISGAEALAWGLALGANKAHVPLVLGSYPITPASSLLHILSNLKEYGVTTFQAEDEIAAVCSAIGASFGGALGLTTSSGPGIALKQEAIGFALSTELPLIIVNVQRGGPSTGLPTKTEQSDLLQVMGGRNGDAPCVIIAARSPSDCFEVGIEAVRIATKYMMPVFVMSDGYLANGSEPWCIPDVDAIEEFPVTFETHTEGFHPFRRDEETLARPWAKPGTPGLEHRVGGLEKDYDSGNISYEPTNHEKMTQVRVERVQRLAETAFPPMCLEQGEETGELLILGWGSTYGSIYQAVAHARSQGHSVSQAHLRYLNPFPRNLGEILGGFKQVLIPEMNTGQLLQIVRGQYLVDAQGLNKI
jgi:2-oxoglutarate ferredoxin oxidoreductase subunit alpha